MQADDYIGKTCPYCQTPIKPGVEVIVCSVCEMPHHADCWNANGGCTTYGCQGSPGATRPSQTQAHYGSGTGYQPTYPPPAQPGAYGGQPLYQDAYDNPYARHERDREGRFIPKEYPQHFNRYGFSWPAFFFPVYWYCLKGMPSKAWKFLLVGIIPYVGGLIAAIWAGSSGYRDYSDLINYNTPEQIQASKRSGMGCFITLLVLVGIYLLVVFGLIALGGFY